MQGGSFEGTEAAGLVGSGDANGAAVMGERKPTQKVAQNGNSSGAAAGDLSAENRKLKGRLQAVEAVSCPWTCSRD